MDEKSLGINNKERLNFRSLLLILTLTSLFSCEGFKVLRLHNYSDNTATVTIKPGYSKMKKYQISNYPNKSNKISDSITVELPRDSSIVLSSIFTSFLGGVKLKERDIRVSYLKIETEKTLVVANSKKRNITTIRQ